MSRLVLLSLLTLGTLGLAVPSSAQLGLGARALGMGGAYTAVADDAYAPYWNPAGLAQLHHFHAALPNLNARLTGPLSADTLLSHFPSSTAGQIAFARRAGNGITQADVSGDAAIAAPRFALSFVPFTVGQVVPRNAQGGVGFRYLNFQGQQVPEPGSQANINAVIAFQTVASAAIQTDSRTSAGINLKLTNYQPTSINVRFDGTNTTLPVTTTTGRTSLAFGADVGVLHHVSPAISVGATLRDVFHPNLRMNGQDVMPTNLSVGAAYRTSNRKLLFAADIGEIGGNNTALNLGAEYSPFRYVQGRIGLYRNRVTLGVGAGHYFNIAYGPGETLLSVSLGF